MSTTADMEVPLTELTESIGAEYEKASPVVSQSSPPPPAPMEFPEGGMQAWLTVAGGCMVLFVTFGAIQSFGVYQDYYTRVTLTEHTPSQISWIGSFQIFLLFAMGLVSGKLFDEGYFHHLMAVGSLIYTFSFFMLSLAQPHNYFQNFLAQGVGIGLGMGFMFLPAISLSSHYFRRRRSLATGLVFAGSSIGGVIYPIMLNHLFFGQVGYAWGVRVAAFIVLGLLIMASFIMKTRLPPRRLRPATEKPDMKAILTDVPYWVCIAGVFLVFWGLYFPFFYLQLFSVIHGVDTATAFYAITILNASSLFGRTVPNFIADSYGGFNVIIPMALVSGVLTFAMFGAGSLSGMVVFAILYGFFSGGFLSMSVPVVGSFARSINEVGIRVGFAMFVLSFALLTGTPISGALVNAPAYTWSRAIIFNGVVILSGTALLILARSMVSKRKNTWRV